MDLIQFLRGFCMALADGVPGVSGGTVAFLLGFYDEFIGSLNQIVAGSREEKKEGIRFLCKIGVGWIAGFICIVLLLASVFDTHIYSVSSLFLGFVLAAIPVVLWEERKTIRGKALRALYVFPGAALVLAISLAGPAGGTGADLGSLTLPLTISLFLAGAAAISAMVLPGISGSTLLLIFGLYMPVIQAVRELLQLHLNYLPALVLFGFGIVAGIVLGIRVLKRALERHRAPLIFLITGMMVGSLYSIVTGPATLDIPQKPMSLSTFHPLLFLAGAGLILGMKWLQNRLGKGKEKACAVSTS